MGNNKHQMRSVDAVVIGAGYYGCRIAIRLRKLGLERVVLVEREGAIMRRASWGNQARVHGGYHYPRSLQTGLACRRSFGRFVEEHEDAITSGLRKYYAVARGSRVSPNQFERFCQAIGAPFHPMPKHVSRMFDNELIEAAYLVEEFAFNTEIIATHIAQRLKAAKVELKLNTVVRVGDYEDASPVCYLGDAAVRTKFIFNCTYAGLDLIGLPIKATLRREAAEIALIRPPRELEGVGVTVMDGPFFSTMPFPALGLHSLSHVRFTPIAAWTQSDGRVQISLPSGVGASENGVAMLRDSARFLPCLRSASIESSFIETKTVLEGNDQDDGRPILFERCAKAPNIYSVLGGKIDNVYDILEILDEKIRGHNEA